MASVTFYVFEIMVIPGRKAKSRKDSDVYDESLIETNVRDNFNNLWYMV